jgi:hypothetical protein
MIKSLKPLALALSLPALFLADLASDAPLRLALVRDAAAIVGAPMTPVSAAGVARRTTARTVAATSAAASTSATAQQQAATAQQQQATAQQQAATAQQQAAVAQQQAAGTPAIGSTVQALPEGCTPLQKGGVEYQQCGNVYFRAAFQGNNLVYVVSPAP